MAEYRKTRKAFNEIGDAHFLTFSCYRRYPLLSRDRSRMWMIEAMKQMREKLNVSIWAYVIMPEHAHLLIHPRTKEYEMRRILASLKYPVSRQAKCFLIDQGQTAWLRRLTVQEGSQRSFRFWQAGGGYDKNVREDRSITEVIDYIHANPVRRGLVERPTDWRWSSARAHADLGNTPLEIDPVLY